MLRNLFIALAFAAALFAATFLATSASGDPRGSECPGNTYHATCHP